jgi:hypothetical protein
MVLTKPATSVLSANQPSPRGSKVLAMPSSATKSEQDVVNSAASGFSGMVTDITEVALGFKLEMKSASLPLGISTA